MPTISQILLPLVSLRILPSICAYDITLCPQLLISSAISGHCFFLNFLSSLDHLSTMDPSTFHAIALEGIP